jgi:CubicO group peptidase (beta-lactamase class C family)
LVSCSRTGQKKDDANSLDVFFSSQFPDDEPGGAVIVMQNDSILFAKGYGLANVKTREKITTKTLFNVGSISKTFVAHGILILASEGKLSVEDSLMKYFPQFKNADIARSVKIKHLLTHTSGLVDNREVDKDTVFYLTAKDRENWAPIMHADTLAFPPGARFAYSNPAYNGLALIIESVSKKEWQQFVIDNIMRPSGMMQSTITNGSYPSEGVSHAYVKDHGHWIEDDYGEEPTFPAAGNGGVWSSVEELAKYEQAIEQGVFLPKDVIEDARTIKTFSNWEGNAPSFIDWSWFRPVDPQKPFMGWSWFIGQTKDGVGIVGHTGSQGGFLANYVVIPDRHIFFVILCNTPRDMIGYSEKIISWLKEHHRIE